jgi:hypothetical protein
MGLALVFLAVPAAIVLGAVFRSRFTSYIWFLLGIVMLLAGTFGSFSALISGSVPGQVLGPALMFWGMVMMMGYIAGQMGEIVDGGTR